MQQLAPAYDRSSYFVTLEFHDETGAPVTPTSITWSLTDGAGTIVNSRDQVAISPPAQTVTVALSGADLAYKSTGTRLENTRKIVCQAMYLNSITNGNMPINKQAGFAIIDVAAV